MNAPRKIAEASNDSSGDSSGLVSGDWYWLRHPNGHVAPYRFHQAKRSGAGQMGEFFVGSMLTTWPLSCVVGKAEMPQKK